MEDAAAANLKPGESLQGSLAAMRYLGWRTFLPLFLIIVAVTSVLAAFDIELRTWVTPVVVGVYFLVFHRSYYVFVTNDRVLLLRVSMYSSKKAAFDYEIPLDLVKSAMYHPQVIGGRLEIEAATGATYRLKVPPIAKRDAERMVDLINGESES